MVACGHCGGCCAHCGAACGHLGGVSFGGVSSFGGGFGGFGFHPYFGGWHSSNPAPGAVPVDGDALSDPDNPGHREAIQTIAHVAGEKFELIEAFLKDERHKLDHHGGDTKS